jgi:hypothetical protein
MRFYSHLRVELDFLFSLYLLIGNLKIYLPLFFFFLKSSAIMLIFTDWQLPVRVYHGLSLVSIHPVDGRQEQ